MKSGIYKIVNLITNKIYVGSAINFDVRFKKHDWELRNNRHGNVVLQRSFNKYGPDAFEFESIEYCEKEKLIEREQFWIDTLKPEYNLAPKADSNLGYKYSEESKKKMSAWQIGRKMSDEARAKMSAAQTGKKRGPRIVSLEARINMRNARLGKKHSEETKIKMGISRLGNKSRTGQKLTEQEKLNISIGCKRAKLIASNIIMVQL